MAKRVLAGEGFDAAQVGADRTLAHDLDRADVAGGRHVRATAQLERVAGLEHSHDVAVLVAEEGDGALVARRLLGHLGRRHARVGEHFGVGQLLDATNLRWRDCLVVAEVESQTIGCHERAGLLHVLTEHAAQRPVQHVRRSVVALGRRPRRRIDGCRHRVAGAERTARDTNEMPAQTRCGECGVEHLRGRRLAGDRAGIADLSAALGVERRGVEEHLVHTRTVFVVEGPEHREHIG